MSARWLTACLSDHDVYFIAGTPTHEEDVPVGVAFFGNHQNCASQDGRFQTTHTHAYAVINRGATEHPVVHGISSTFEAATACRELVGLHAAIQCGVIRWSVRTSDRDYQDETEVPG